MIDPDYFPVEFPVEEDPEMHIETHGLRAWRAFTLALLVAFVLGMAVANGAERASDVIQSNLIDAPDRVDPDKLITVKLPPDLPYAISPKPENAFSFVDERSGKRIVFILDAKPPGYSISVDYAVVHPTDEEIKSAPWDDREAFAKWLTENRRDEVYRDEHFVKVGEPTPPDPPDPDPDPDPEPDPDPAPIPTAGFRVLIIEETEDRAKIPESQRQILASTRIREFANQNCIKVNGQPEFRQFDQHQDMQFESDVWKQAMKVPRTKLPWILISNGKAGYSGELPQTVDDTIALMQKYVVK